MAEALTGALAPGRATYVLAGVAGAAARGVCWLLPELREINGLGVDRMVGGLHGAAGWLVCSLQNKLGVLLPTVAAGCLSVGVWVDGVVLMTVCWLRSSH